MTLRITTSGFGLALAGVVVSAGMAFGQAAPAMTGDTAKGKVLTDAKGMTLYTFDKDADGKSACNGPCTNNWPPLLVTGDAKPSGDWSVVARDDGGKQWAFKSKPLYTWAKDTKPGDTNGDGFLNNMWHIAKP
jgi:predicted lipoprotein with Yx(FWY)xxD motif